MIITRMLDDWKRYNIQDTDYYKPLKGLIHVEIDKWQLGDSPVLFTWTWDRGRNGVLLPVGYQWNPSIPKIARNIVDVDASIDFSLLHDALYESQGGTRAINVENPDKTHHEEWITDYYTGEHIDFSRARCDALAFAFALCSGMQVGMAECMYTAVYLFGQDKWND